MLTCDLSLHQDKCSILFCAGQEGSIAVSIFSLFLKMNVFRMLFFYFRIQTKIKIWKSTFQNERFAKL